MLSKALMGSSSPRVALVASKAVNFLGGGYASSSISLSDMPIQTGDLIVFCTSTYSTVSVTISVNLFNNYTAIHSGSDPGDDLYAANFYKVATSLESSINFEWSPGTGTDISAIVAVFRGYEYNSETNSFAEEETANPPSISCSVNDLIIASYHYLGGTINAIPTGYTLVNKVTANSNTSVNLFYKIATSTTEDPQSLFNSNSDESAFGGTIRCTPI